MQTFKALHSAENDTFARSSASFDTPLFSAIRAVGTPLKILLMMVLLTGIANAQQSSVVLMKRVERALRDNNNLNGASVYTAAPGVVVLYGRVFDKKDRILAEQTASNVRGVKQVVNTLRTMTGEWLEEEERINDTLQLNDLHGVSVRVIGSHAYLSGQVSSQADKDRAVAVVSSESKLQIVNLIRIVPGPLFSSTNFF